tara:strand:+ start:544 stop:690 length:147 start_codon:yes stop_codon:yes gene_type:complete
VTSAVTTAVLLAMATVLLETTITAIAMVNELVKENYSIVCNEKQKIKV